MSKANGGNGGIIVNVASVLGLTIIPGTPIYNATKHAAIAFTRSLGVKYSQFSIEIISRFSLPNFFSLIVTMKNTK